MFFCLKSTSSFCKYRILSKPSAPSFAFTLSLSQLNYLTQDLAVLTIFFPPMPFLLGFFPKRYGYKVHSVSGHNRTSLVCRHEQSWHFFLIALSGVNFFTIMSSIPQPQLSFLHIIALLSPYLCRSSAIFTIEFFTFSISLYSATFCIVLYFLQIYILCQSLRRLELVTLVIEIFVLPKEVIGRNASE